MSNGVNSPETFRACSDPATKLDMLYDAVTHLVESDKHQCSKCEKRLDECKEQFNSIKISIQKNRKIDMGLAATGGVIGGVMAWFAKWAMGK